MKVFFVRHAHSMLNGKGSHQHSTTPLSSQGMRQAAALAKRFSRMHVDAIISSKYKRAQQTARKISEATHRRVLYTPLLNERKYPSEIEGLHFDDPKARATTDLMYSHANDPKWHYSDEENFTDFRRRCMAFISYVARTNKENVVVITHSGTARMIIACMLFGKDLTLDLYSKVNNFLRLENTGITACSNDDQGVWRLLVWNDHAHRSDYLIDGSKVRKKHAS